MGNYILFKDISLRMTNNDMLCLAGLSEERAKYFFYLIRGAKKPNEGWVEVDPTICPLIEFKSRHVNHIPELTVLECVYFLAALRGYGKSLIEQHVTESLSILGIESNVNDRIHCRDAVMLQKVSLIACFSGCGFLYLLDNPTHGINETDQKKEILSYIYCMHKRRKITIIATINDIEEAAILRSRLFVFTESGFFDLGLYKRKPTNQSHCLYAIFEMNFLVGTALERAIISLREMILRYFDNVYRDMRFNNSEKLVFAIPYPFERRKLLEFTKDISENGWEIGIAAFYLHEPNIYETTMNALYDYSTVSKGTQVNFIKYCTNGGLKPRPPMVDDVFCMPNFKSCGKSTRSIETQTSRAKFIRWLKTKDRKSLTCETMKDDVPAQSNVTVISHRDLDDSMPLRCTILKCKVFYYTLSATIASRMHEFRCAKCALLYIIIPWFLLLFVVSSQFYQGTKEELVLNRKFDDLLSTSESHKLRVFFQQDQQYRSIAQYELINESDSRLQMLTSKGFARVLTPNCRKDRCADSYIEVCQGECQQSIFATNPSKIEPQGTHVECLCDDLNVCTTNQSHPPLRLVDNKIVIFDLTFRDINKWLLQYINNETNSKLPLTYGIQFHVGLSEEEFFTTCVNNTEYFLTSELCVYLHFSSGTNPNSTTLWFNTENDVSHLLALTTYNSLLVNKKEEPIRDIILEVHEEKMHHPIIDLLYRMEYVVTSAFLSAFAVTVFLLWISASQLSHVLRQRFNSLSHLHFLYQGTECYYWMCNYVVDLFHYIFMWVLLSAILFAFNQLSFLAEDNIFVFASLSVLHGASSITYGYIWTYACRPSDHHHSRVIIIWVGWLSIATISTLLIYYISLTSYNPSPEPNTLGAFGVWIAFAILFPPFVLCHGLFVLAFHYDMKEQSQFMLDMIPSPFSLSFCRPHLIVLGGHAALSIFLLWLSRTNVAYLETLRRHKIFRHEIEEEESLAQPTVVHKLPPEIAKKPVIFPYIREKVFVLENVETKGRSFANRVLTPLRTIATAIKLRKVVNKPLREKNVYNITIRKGGCVGLVGPMKSGKSSLLRMLAGITSAKEGKCYAFGNDISIYGVCTLGEVAFCPNTDDLLHCAYPTELKEYFYKCFHEGFEDKNNKERRSWMREVVTSLKLDKTSIADTDPGPSLRRKIVVAATLIVHRPVLLFDEPFANLDEADVKAMKKLFSNLHKNLNATIVFTSLDLWHCQDICDEVYLLDANLGCFGGNTVKELYLENACGYFIECHLERNTTGKARRELQAYVTRKLQLDCQQIKLVAQYNNNLLYFLPKKNENLAMVLQKISQLQNGGHIDDYVVQHGSYAHLLTQLGRANWNIEDSLQDVYV